MTHLRISFLFLVLFIGMIHIAPAQTDVAQRMYELSMGGTDSATWAAEKATLDPGNPWHVYLDAVLIQKTQDYERASVAMEKALATFRETNKMGTLLALSQLSGVYSNMRDDKRGKPRTLDCIRQSTPDMPELRGHCILNYASERRRNHDFDSAFYLMKEARVLFRTNKLPEDEALALMNMGAAFHFLDQSDSAAHYYLESIRMLESTESWKQLAKAYNNLSILFNTMGDLAQGKRYLAQSTEIRMALGDDHGLAATHSTMGNIYLAEAKWDSAAAAFAEAERLYIQVGDQLGMLWSFNNVANASYYGGDIPKAHVYFNKAYAQSLALNDSIEMSRISSNLGWSFLGLEKPDSAKHWFEQGIAIAERLQNLETKEIAYSGMADYFIEVGDYKQALDYYTKSRDIKDKIINEQRTRQLAEMQTKFETEKKEREITRLDKQNVEAQLRISKQRSWIVGIAAAALILLISGGLIYLQRKRRNEAQMAQKELEFRKKLLDATVLAEEKERQRIAKDMHDGLVQTLAAIKMGLQSVGRKMNLTSEVKNDFDEKVTMVDEATDEARNLSHQMMPRALMEAGLITALDDMLHKTLRHAQMEYTFEHFGIGEQRFDERVEIGLYRIAQEMVNNIIKHSGATEASMQLIKTKTHLVLHIEDNGQGFAPEDQPEKSGIGLNNIFSRASSVNGEVSFEEGQPKGTIANVRVPIEEPKLG